MDSSPVGKTMSKTAKVLNELQTNGSITSMDAFRKFNSTRLSAIIFNLRQNHIIDSVWETHTNKDGETSRYTRYVYRGEIK